ncbi:MAG: ABC transporter permease [Endomicrobiales bacterium]
MHGPVFQVFKKELLEIRRGRVAALLLIAPLAQVVIFGFVATTDIVHVETMICDEDGSARSRRLADKFSHTEYFDVVSFTREPSDIQPAFNRNKARLAVRVGKGFSRDIKKGGQVPVQLIVDGSNSNMAAIVLNYSGIMVRDYSREVFETRMEQMKKTLGDLPSVNMEERVWYNPELKSANTMVPGVIGLILMLITLVVTSISLVREKESGNIEQLIVTPIKPYQIIIGKILPYILLALVNVVLITVLSMLVFDLSFQGSFLLLLTLSLFMIVANLGVGIFVSTVSSTQQQAMLSDIFFYLPNMLLSGFIFPIKNMPEFFQWLTYLIPLRYYMVIIRGIFLKGLTFTELYPQVAALALFSVAVFTLAIIRFKKKLS